MNERLTTTAAGDRFTRILLWLAEAVPLRFVSL
jgi:hypothetical protein